MTFWLNAQLSPALTPWLAEQSGVEAHSVRQPGYRDAADRVIFEAARAAKAVVITKDGEFVSLLEQFDPPPQVLWVTLGNTSNARMKAVLLKSFSSAVSLLEAGEPLVEIGEAH
jgi:predicted nuclease of predicted toxin-antitoxin system